MVHSPSWEANSFAASQEIPRISRNPKVHYRTHKRPPPVPILGQPNPVHIPTSHLLEIHSNIIHPSTHRSPQWFPSLRFPHQDPIHPSLLTHTRHMPSPSHSSRFHHSHNIGWGVKYWLTLRNYITIHSTEHIKSFLVRHILSSGRYTPTFRRSSVPPSSGSSSSHTSWPEEGSSTLLRNRSKYLPIGTMKCPRKLGTFIKTA